jgi:hypothetical protein
MMHKSISIILAFAALVFVAASVGAMPIETGLYRLHNHPDGNMRPPFYGLRLDGLNGDNAEEFTFDFDDPQSAMFLDYSGSEIHIFGQSFGGRDIGNAYANDVFRGVYTIDFTYDMNLSSSEDGGTFDDVVVSRPFKQPGLNFGTISGPGIGTVHLRDKASDENLTFVFGDEGGAHRGFVGLSGFGWLDISRDGGRTFTHTDAQDWIFTAERQQVAEPAAMVLLLSGLLGLAARKLRVQ